MNFKYLENIEIGNSTTLSKSNMQQMQPVPLSVTHDDFASAKEYGLKDDHRYLISSAFTSVQDPSDFILYHPEGAFDSYQWEINHYHGRKKFTTMLTQAAPPAEIQILRVNVKSIHRADKSFTINATGTFDMFAVVLDGFSFENFSPLKWEIFGRRKPSIVITMPEIPPHISQPPSLNDFVLSGWQAIDHFSMNYNEYTKALFLQEPAKPTEHYRMVWAPVK